MIRTLPTGVIDPRYGDASATARPWDVVVEGVAERVTDAGALQALADAWADKYADDWRFAVRGEEFVELSDSGGSTEGGAWVFRVPPTKVLVFGDEHGQTAYRF